MSDEGPPRRYLREWEETIHSFFGAFIDTSYGVNFEIIGKL